MKKAILTAAAALAIFGVQSAPASAVALWEDATYPIVDTMDQAVRSPKVGTAICKNLLGLIKWGDCSTNAAMKNGNITQVEYGDVYKKWVILYGEDTVKVYGK